MPRIGKGWKEAGWDTSRPPPPIRDRKRWLEIYVGWCYQRLATLDQLGTLPKEDLFRLKLWMLNPDWIGDK